MNFEERAVSFSCHDDWLYGIIGVPERALRRGVLIVVGGPQYRVGSHRQFTLLARSLAAQGIASLRFDYRGMGDSDGAARDFEHIADDLRVAVDQLMGAVPGMTEVVVWGLCDAASAAMFYAGTDARVTGLVLANPWARTTEGFAKTTLKHYYGKRLMQPEFWKKIVSGRFNVLAAGKAFSKLLGAAFGTGADEQASTGAWVAAGSLPERMLAGLGRFDGKVLLIISGVDLTAQEFLQLVKGSDQWQRLLGSPRMTQHYLATADHTFSRRAWRDQVATWTGDWICSW